MVREKKNDWKASNEYLEVLINPKIAQLCRQCYETLGWEIISSTTGINLDILRMKRSKKIKNRVELCKLQRECEDALIKLEQLEKIKNSKEKRTAIMSSLIGVTFLIGTVITYSFNIYFVSIVFAALGIVGWGIAFLLYKRYILKNENKIKQEINESYDIIYQVCEKAKQLVW